MLSNAAPDTLVLGIILVHVGVGSGLSPILVAGDCDSQGRLKWDARWGRSISSADCVDCHCLFSSSGSLCTAAASVGYSKVSARPRHEYDEAPISATDQRNRDEEDAVESSG